MPGVLIQQIETTLLDSDRSGWSQNGASFQQKSMQVQFERQVSKNPVNTAVTHADQQLTYAGLNRRVNQLAHYLKRLGVSVECRVGVCLDRSVESLVALLAVFKAGGTYVPLDPAYPAERLNYMLTDSQVMVLLTSSDASVNLADNSIVSVCLDDAQGQIEQEAADNPALIVHGENLAYVIYTSGSTGRPKGVMVEHRGLSNVLAASQERFGFDTTDVMPCLASFSFDISLFELCNPLCAGGTVAIWNQKDVLDVELLIESLEELTFLHCVPTLMQQIVSSMKTKGHRSKRLRRVLVGGEKVGLQLLEDMREVFPGAEVHVLYGPTEGTMICAHRLVTERLTAAPIGRVIQDMQLLVLDEKMKQAPIGTVGELYIGGVGVARGYLNRPELTAAQFVPNCFSEETGARLYRTGDLATWRADGNLEFVGRVDQQVKIRGHRIELGEIEATLERCPGITEAVVTIREDEAGQERLVAYVTAKAASLEAPQPAQQATWFSPAIHDYVYDRSPLTLQGQNETEAHPYYREITENVRGKTILIVCTDQEKLLLRACLEGSAKRVYVAEYSADAFASTRRFVQRRNLVQVIPFLLGGEVPDIPASSNGVDICMSDLVGDIGGSKRLDVFLQQLKKLIDAETIIFPQSCITYLSAVELPESLRERAEFCGAPYQDACQIFAAAGYPFDVKVRLHQLPPASLISGESIFEQVTTSAPRLGSDKTTEHQIQLTISRQATLCGFVLTPKLYGHMAKLGHLKCCFAADAPVFLPIFVGGVQVERGDRIEGRCIARPSIENPLHMDYRLEGRILHRHGGIEPFFYRLPFIQRAFQGSEFYKKLFSTMPSESLVSGGQQRGARQMVQEVWDKIKSELPDYMLPSAIVKLKEFPLTPNGKLDRRALPAPDYSSGLIGRAPQGPQQEALCTLFAEALGAFQVSLDDSFFDLGGDSIMVIQLVRRIRDTLGVTLSIRAFFEAPTVAGLTERLREMET
jgi:amino acid adenylation domain-containing protein